MSPDRWQRAQALFAEAVALPVEAREAHVRLAAADDATLCEQVLALLAHDADTGTIDAGDVQHLLQRAAAQAVGLAPGGGADRLAGQRLGPWRIVRHLADGGMGAVYLAERADGAFVQQVAIKLLNPAAVSPEAAARLAAERRLLARLQHPLIARLLDGGTSAEGAPYLVMEYVDGLPIDRWCDAQAVDTRARHALDGMPAVAPWKPAVQAALEAAMQGRPLDADLHTALQALPPSDGWRVLATTAPQR